MSLLGSQLNVKKSKMDWLRSFLPGFIYRPHRHPPDDYSDYTYPSHSNPESFRRDNFEDDDRRFGGFGFFAPFPRNFEDMRKEMDESFDELFKIFGVDNLPMFDPYIPDHPQFPGGFGQQPKAQLPHANENVRDRMLKGSDNSQYDDETVNVRSRMLRRSPNYPGAQAGRPERRDINWDSFLKEGGNMNDILEKRSQLPDGEVKKDTPVFQFRYSSTTTRRRPDGTIETRRVTRDESGNEQETVEVKGGQL
ncbi:HCLS1-associated protein X-1-like [Watersipora subatra]|uniref:HCLS1-associated protein X-1-like n=1 Tax=Watersipora subatra TaxID=2589382 RepID=UPI00355B224E